MPAKRTARPRLEVHPLTPDRWADFEKLFGQRGACGGCWCMWWRLRRSQFEKQKGAPNKRAMKRIVNAGEIPGLLAYVRGEPVGWCSVAPREAYPVLSRSRILKPIDDKPVWSVVCFFIAKAHRRTGLSVKLLEAVTAYARKNGAKIIEGYPVPRALAGRAIEPRAAEIATGAPFNGQPPDSRLHKLTLRHR